MTERFILNIAKIIAVIITLVGIFSPLAAWTQLAPEKDTDLMIRDMLAPTSAIKKLIPDFIYQQFKVVFPQSAQFSIPDQSKDFQKLFPSHDAQLLFALQHNKIERITAWDMIRKFELLDSTASLTIYMSILIAILCGVSVLMTSVDIRSRHFNQLTALIGILTLLLFLIYIPYADCYGNTTTFDFRLACALTMSQPFLGMWLTFGGIIIIILITLVSIYIDDATPVFKGKDIDEY